MQQVTASMPGNQDIGSHASGDGWLTALAVHRGSFLPLHRQIHDLVRQEIDARVRPDVLVARHRSRHLLHLPMLLRGGCSR